MDTDERAALIRTIHRDASRVWEHDSARRHTMAELTGELSCAAMDVAQLRKVRDYMEERMDGQARGGKGRGRPTKGQWAKLGGLCRKKGWTGLEDPRFAAFVERTAKVSNPRFLTREQATAVAVGLEKWTAS